MHDHNLSRHLRCLNTKPGRLGRTLLIALLVSCLSLTALAQETTSGPTVVSQAWLPAQRIDGVFTEAMVVLEFAPGAAMPLHAHGGPTLVTVLEGEITLREDEAEKTYAAGESWTEMPGQVHEAYNAGSVATRVAATFLLSGDAEATLLEVEADSSVPAPTAVYRALFPDLSMAGVFNELMTVLEFAPGAGMPLHTHGGPTLVTVLEGEITLREDEAEITYAAGESWTEMPGHVHEAYNAGSTPVKVVVTFLLPVAAATTPVEQ